MVTQLNYDDGAVKAAKSVIIELTHILNEYKDDIVLIGGWVPYLLLTNSIEPHIGSMDVDLALNHKKLLDAGYKTIKEILISKGYTQGNQPFTFHRVVIRNGKDYTVHLDLLAGEYQGTGKKHKHQKIQDVFARKTQGCDLAFELATEIEITGELPEGNKDTVKVRVSTILPFLVMKGMALAGRLKEKDAWDIYYCIKNYPGGINAIAKEFKNWIDNKLVKKGLDNIAEKFKDVDFVGPKHVADFEGIEDSAEREVKKRDAFESVSELLVAIKNLRRSS